MVQIVLTKEQAEKIARANEGVELLDEQGRSLGVLTRGYSAEELKLAKERARSEGPWYTTAQVLEYLQTLE
jgi:hypothetical protein